MNANARVTAAGCHLFGHCNCRDHIAAGTCCWCGTNRIVTDEEEG